MAFALTRTRYTGPTNALSSLRINGTDSRELGAQLTGFPDLLLPPTDSRLMTLEGRGGSIDAGSNYGDTWTFTLNFQITGFSLDDVNDRRRELLRWIDVEQHQQNYFVVGSVRVKTLKIELSGFKYFYKTGQVQVTNSSNVVWGTGIQRTTQLETTTSTTANKLNDTSVNFTNLGIAINDVVINITDDTATRVTAIDSATVLSVEDDIMASGETYRIYQHPRWRSYIKPGVVFHVEGDTTDYFVESVQNDSKIALTANVTRSTASELVYRAERRMYLFANYNGSSSTSTIHTGFFSQSALISGTPQTVGYTQDISIGFETTIPYLLGDEFVYEQLTITEADTTGEFIDIEGIGNSICRPTYQIIDEANAPEITTGIYAFTSNFLTSPNASDVQNKAAIEPTTFTANLRYDATVTQLSNANNASIPVFGDETGSDAPTIIYDTMVDGRDIDATTSGLPTQDPSIQNGFNRNQGTLRCLFQVGFNPTTTVFDHYVLDDGNSFTIKFSATNNVFEITDGTNTASSQAISFVLGDFIDVIAVWDKNNLITTDTGTTNLFIAIGEGGTLKHTTDTGKSYSAVTSETTINIGSDKNSAKSLDGYIDEIAIWDWALETTAWANLYGSGTPIPAPEAIDSDGHSVSHGMVMYMPITGSSGPITDFATVGSRDAGTRLPTTSTTTTTVVFNDSNHDDIFADDDPITIYDEAGQDVQGFVDTSLNSGSTMGISSTTGSAALTNADTVGVYLNMADTYMAVAATNAIHDVTTKDIGLGAIVSLPTTSPNSTVEVVACKANDVTTGAGYSLYVLDGVISFSMDDGVDHYKVVGNTDIRDGKFHHIVGIIDKSDAAKCRIWLDGFEDGTPNKTGTLANVGSLTNAVVFTIGANSDLSNIFSGKIRDVLFSQETNIVGASKLGQLNGGTNTGPITTLASTPRDFSAGATTLSDSWECSEGTGTTITGASNNLTLSDAIAWEQLAFVSRNMIVDPYMENGGIGGFDLAEGVTQTLNKESDAKNNNQSMNMVTAASTHKFSIAMNQTAGEDYVFRMWYKVASGDRINIQSAGAAGNLTETNDLSSTTYAFYEACVEQSVTSATQAIIFTADAGDVTIDINIDHIMYIPNLLSDGSFEDWTTATDLADWTETIAGSSTVDQNTAEERTSTDCLQLSIDASGSNAEVSQDISVTADKFYEISIWAKISSETSTPEFQIGEDISSSTEVFHDFTPTTTYQRFSFIVKAASTGTSTYRIRRKSGSASESKNYFFDDASIVRLNTLDATMQALTPNELFEDVRGSYGIHIHPGDVLYYNDVIGNRNQGSVVFRFQPQYDYDTTSSIDKYLFSWLSDNSGIDTNDFIKFYYDVSTDSFVLTLSNAGTEIGQTAITGPLVFDTDEYLEVSCWWNVNGVIDEKDGLTYYAKIIANGEIIGSETDAITQYIPSSHMKHLFIGGLNSLTSTTTMTNELDGLLDDAALYIKALSDEELRSIYINQEPLLNDNTTMTFNKVMAENDIFTYHTDTGSSRYWDEDVGLENDAESFGKIEGYNPMLRGDDLKEEAIIYVKASANIPKFTVSWRSYNH